LGRKNVNGHYVKNADLLAEIIIFKQTGIVTDRLGGMLLSIANNYTTKGNFIGYTWKNDMVGDAMLTCLKYLKNFNPERSSNAFAYITQIIKNSFRAYLKEQKKHAQIKDICYNRYIELVQSDPEKFGNTTAINYEILADSKKGKRGKKPDKIV
jgi:DNA-directed RNA polymerase specialized sigma24 family protein